MADLDLARFEIENLRVFAGKGAVGKSFLLRLKKINDAKHKKETSVFHRATLDRGPFSGQEKSLIKKSRQISLPFSNTLPYNPRHLDPCSSRVL